MKRFVLSTTALVVTLAAMVAGVSFTSSGGPAPETTEGAALCPITVKVRGSTTVFPIMQQGEGGFEALWAPGTDAQLGSIGSTAGLAELTAGTTDVAPSSRIPTAAGITGKYVFSIAFDGFVLAVQQSAPMAFLDGPGIQVTHLTQMYSAGAGIASLQWDDLTPAIPGAPARNVVPRARSEASGSVGDFRTSVGVSTAAEQATITATGLPRLLESIDMAEAARDNQDHIAYTSLANLDVAGIKVLKVNGILPSTTTVFNGSYPLPRELYLATRNIALEPRIDFSDQVRGDDVINYFRSPAGFNAIVAQGFLPRPAAVHQPFPDHDINLDGNTSLGDLGAISAKWGQVAPGGCKGWIRADANNSGNVSLADIGGVTSKWGQAGFVCAAAGGVVCAND